MVTRAENGKLAQQVPDTLPEQGSLSGNSFVDFLRTNGDEITAYSTASNALRRYDAEQKGSPELAGLIKTVTDTGLSIHFPRGYTKKQYDVYLAQQIARVHGMVFDLRVPVEGGMDDRIIRGTRGLNSAGKEVFEAATSRIADLGNEYRNGRHEYVTQQAATKKDAFEQFRGYLGSGPASFSDLAAFLTERGYLPEREAVRPFLTELARDELRKDDMKNPKLMDEVKQQIINDEVQNPSLTSIEEFSGDVVQREELWQWVQFALKVRQGSSAGIKDWTEEEKQQEVAALLKDFPIGEAWPSVLIGIYTAFLMKKLTHEVATVREGLRAFQAGEQRVKPEENIFPAIEDEGKLKTRPEVSAEIHTWQTVEEAYKETFIDTSDEGIRVEEEPDWENLPYQVVRSFSPNGKTVYENVDPRRAVYAKAEKYPSLRADFERMMYTAMTNPLGEGTKLLDYLWIPAIGMRRIKMREFKPSEVPGFVLDNQESYRFRIIYAVDSAGEHPIIILRGIFHHNELDQNAHKRKKK